ncbi:unnamed protein product, partial [Rotaria sp. Silwood2]
MIIDTTPKDNFKYQRQQSRWSKAKHIIKLLRNLFQACIRFKKFMLRKKRESEQKYNFENLLHQTIEHFLYEDVYKTPTSINNDEQHLKLDELEKCLCRQHERALIRLITYRFMKTFLQNILNLENNNQCQIILSIYLPYLKEIDLEWSYFDNIPASNNQLKEEISNNYYSIIKLVLSICLKSKSLVQKIFYLLNLSYETIDLCHLYNYQLIETLFILFVSFVHKSEHNISLDLKLTSFNWFRLLVFKLCENIETEKRKHTFNQILEKQNKFIFNILILNELKDLKQIQEDVSNNSQEQKENSLKNISISWFLLANEINNNTLIFSNTYEMELYKNQYLVLLLQCSYRYKHVLSICANVDYLKELLNIYHNSESNITRLLTIKILRYLIPYIPDSIDGLSKNFIEKFLIDTLDLIGKNNISQEILAELIYMYRTIMSINSSWQIIATKFIIDSIELYLNLKSIELNDLHEMNKLLASLCILGEYIEPYRLGSIVTVDNDKKLNDDTSLALIIEIDSNI